MVSLRALTQGTDVRKMTVFFNEVPGSGAMCYRFCENGVSFARRPACHYFTPWTVHDLDHLRIYRDLL